MTKAQILEHCSSVYGVELDGSQTKAELMELSRHWRSNRLSSRCLICCWMTPCFNEDQQMTIAMRTSVAISSGGISAQLIRLLPPAGCPGEAVWVPPNEVQRWEHLGFGRAPIPAAELELSWQPAGPESGGLIPIELLLNPRTTPPNAVTVDWGDGTAETLPWPVGGDGNGRLQHGYTSRRN